MSDGHWWEDSYDRDPIMRRAADAWLQLAREHNMTPVEFQAFRIKQNEESYALEQEAEHRARVGEGWLPPETAKEAASIISNLLEVVETVSQANALRRAIKLLGGTP